MRRVRYHWCLSHSRHLNTNVQYDQAGEGDMRDSYVYEVSVLARLAGMHACLLAISVPSSFIARSINRPDAPQSYFSLHKRVIIYLWLSQLRLLLPKFKLMHQLGSCSSPSLYMSVNTYIYYAGRVHSYARDPFQESSSGHSSDSPKVESFQIMI